MQPTPAARGVRQLFPFLKKHAPDAFLPIPSYAALAHARIAVDATLLTQKFVYGDEGAAAPHLAGLAGVVHALRGAGAVPIMVFDHPTARLPQKQFAKQKRTEQRALQHFRHAVESERHPRAAALHDAVRTYDAMDWREKHAVSAALRAGTRGASRLANELAALRAACDAQRTHIAAHAPLTESAGQRAVHAAEAGIYAALAAASVDGLQTLLVRPPADVREVPLTGTAGWLRRRSAELLATYTRATRAVTAEMYADCVELCTLLGVPVLVAGEGGAPGGAAVHEAEAFASALVREGFADLVASEDSDVLLYHVPLVRGLGARRGACELVDAQRVRTALFPEADAPPAHAEAQRRAKLVQYALLCGTDFNQTVPGLGPVGAYRYVREHGTVERVLRAAPYTSPLALDAYLAQLADAAHVFEHPPAVDALAAAAGLVRAGAADAHEARGARVPAWAAFLGTAPARAPPCAPRADAAQLAAFLASRGVPVSL